MSILIFILIIFFCYVVLEIPVYAIILGIIGIIAFFSLIYIIDGKMKKEMAENVVKASLIKEIAVYGRKSVCIGYSVAWHEKSRHYYTYKDILDHYDCVFLVTRKDGSVGRIKCRKDSQLYKDLISK